MDRLLELGIVVMSNSERIALFIDGQNLYYAAKSLGFGVDFKRLLFEFQRHGTIVRPYYYAAISENADQSARSLLDWLNYNGFTVLAKPTKEFDDGEGRRKIKGNIGVELAVDALEISDRIDHLVLFSGDGDLRALVEAVQWRGVRVTVVSTIRTSPRWSLTSCDDRLTPFWISMTSRLLSGGQWNELNNLRATAREHSREGCV